MSGAATSGGECACKPAASHLATRGIIAEGKSGYFLHHQQLNLTFQGPPGVCVWGGNRELPR